MANTADLMWLSTAVPSIVTSSLILNLNPSTYTSGATWNDSSVSGYNATLVASPTFTSAGLGSYFTFNGSTQYAKVPTGATGLDNLGKNASGMTYSAWINPQNITNCPPIIGKGNGAAGAGQKFSLMLSGGTTNAIETLFDSSGNGADKGASFVNTGMSFNNWFNVVFTKDDGSNVGTTSQLHIYVNGVEYATSSGVSTVWQASTSGTNSSDAVYDTNIGYEDTADFFLGGTGSGYAAPRFAAMKFGQILIYNKMLTSVEVAQNFAATRINYGV